MLNDVQNAFILEQWLEYGIGMSVFVLRFYARWKSVGFEGYSWDDLFAGLSMVSCISSSAENCMLILARYFSLLILPY